MKYFFVLTAFSVLVFACSPKLAPSAATPKVTYLADIAPLLEKSCTPCHFPAQNGKKAPLDSYEQVEKYYNASIKRVQLPTDDEEFMPFKLKKPALTPEEIQLLQNWAAGGFQKE